MRFVTRSAVVTVLFVFLIAVSFPCYAALEDGEVPHVTGGASAEMAVDITDTGALDCLQEKTDVRWYSFRVEAEGDAVVIFYFEGYYGVSYDIDCWECAIFGQDKSTLLKAEDVEKGYSFLAVNDLPVGTYYIRVQMSQNIENPDSRFPNDEYSLSVVTCAMSGTNVTGDAICKVSEPGELLCVLDGTIFLKAFGGEAAVGLCTNKDGLTGPLLASLDNDSVSIAYFSSRTGEIYSNHTNTAERYGTYDHHYSSDEGYVECTLSDTASSGLYHCGGGEKMNEVGIGAAELLNVYYGKAPDDGLKFEIFMASLFGSTETAACIVGCCIIAVVVIIIVVAYIRDKMKYEAWKEKVRRSPYSDTGNDSYYVPAKKDDGAWCDGKPWSANHDNAKDM